MRTMKFRGKVEGTWWYVRVADQYTSDAWEHFWSLVDRKTVGEWTTLFDKNGSEMYEGDIVMRDNNAHPHVVEWDKDGYWLRNTIVNTGIEGIDEKHCTVIGNIYEHPDLLK